MQEDLEHRSEACLGRAASSPGPRASSRQSHAEDSLLGGRVGVRGGGFQLAQTGRGRGGSGRGDTRSTLAISAEQCVQSGMGTACASHANSLQVWGEFSDDLKEDFRGVGILH